VGRARRVACINLPQSRQIDGTIRGLMPPAQQSQATHRTRIFSRCRRDPDFRHKHRRPKLRRSMWHGWKGSFSCYAKSTCATRRLTGGLWIGWLRCLALGGSYGTKSQRLGGCSALLRPIAHPQHLYLRELAKVVVQGATRGLARGHAEQAETIVSGG
jgi:hypothetical protein